MISTTTPQQLRAMAMAHDARAWQYDEGTEAREYHLMEAAALRQRALELETQPCDSPKNN